MKTTTDTHLGNPQELLFTLSHHSYDVVIIADNNRRIIYANPTACQKTGYKLKELIGQKVLLLYREVDQAKYTSKIFHKLRRSGKWTGEVEVRKKNGTTFWTDTVVAMYYDKQGKPAGTIGIGRDITNDKLLSQRLMEEDNRLQSVIESMGDAVCVCDKQGKILMVNSAHSSMLGYGKDELVGVKPPYPWIDANDIDKTKTMFRKVKKEKSVKNISLVWRRRDNDRLKVSAAMSRYVDPLHGIDGQVCTYRDVTNVDYTEDLSKANEQIQRLMFNVKQKTLRLETLEETNTLVLHQADVAKIFQEITNGVKKLVHHDLAGIYVYDAKQESLVPHTLSKQTAFSRKLAKFPLRMGQGIIGEAAVSGEMVWLNNAQYDPRSKYPEGMKPEREHFIAVPLKGKDSIFGILVVARNSNPGFIEEEAEVIESFADAASVALENVRMIHLLTREQQNLSKTLFVDVVDLLNNVRKTKYRTSSQSLLKADKHNPSFSKGS